MLLCLSVVLCCLALSSHGSSHVHTYIILLEIGILLDISILEIGRVVCVCMCVCVCVCVCVNTCQS